MSSTLRRQQIEEIKNYNQNINRQVLAKAHSQVALWELERPELTPITSEFTATIETDTENLKVLLNEKLSLLDKVIEEGSITEKEFKSITKYSDIVQKYNELITPLLKGRFDYKYKSIAKNATITIKQEIVGLNIGFKKLLDNIGVFGSSKVKIYVESFSVYDFINYQIDTENYQIITINVLKSRIPQILSKLPEEVQLLYVKSQKMYEPLRASVRKEEGEPVFEQGQIEQQSPELEEARAEPVRWSDTFVGSEEEIKELLRTYKKSYIKGKIIAGLNKELKDTNTNKRGRTKITKLIRLAKEVFDEKEIESPRKPRGKPPGYEGVEEYEEKE
jgi:hypothetical protein